MHKNTKHSSFFHILMSWWVVWERNIQPLIGLGLRIKIWPLFPNYSKRILMQSRKPLIKLSLSFMLTYIGLSRACSFLPLISLLTPLMLTLNYSQIIKSNPVTIRKISKNFGSNLLKAQPFRLTHSKGILTLIIQNKVCRHKDLYNIKWVKKILLLKLKKSR